MENKPETGKILIAEPFLNDPNFGRSVILVCEHNKNGTFGLVLNKQIKENLSDIVHEVFMPMPVYMGGPVEINTLHFIHTLGEKIPDSVNLGNGIYWSGDFETIKSLINLGQLTQDEIRFFVGYSGWGENQLQEELKKKSWIVSDINASLAFETDTKLFWKEILRNMGGKYSQMANYPIDPRLN